MMRRAAVPVSLLLAFAMAFAIVPDAPAAETAAPRIVSVGGSVTEIVFALGFGDRVVAADTTSVYPAATADLPKVGYMRQLAAEPILSLAPTLVLAEPNAGPPAVLDQLRAAGAALVPVPDAPTPDGVARKIVAIGDALGAPERARALADSVAGDLDRARALVAGLTGRPRVLFLLSVGSGTPLATGRSTAADGMIALAGGVNAIDGYEGYKPLSPEAAVAAAPEIVLVTGRTLAALGGVDGIAGLPAIAATPAGRNRRIVAMDALLMLGFGPRTGAAVEQLAALFHPGALAGATKP